MGTKTEAGRIVWHDLMTNDIAKAKHFYAEMLNWEYQIEHATDFAWKSGEADYPLIVENGQAHGGFVDPGQKMSSHWCAYVTVENVDAVTAKAKALGAVIDRMPFDAPGVGRSAVIRDSQGAIICPHTPSHNFPAPSGMFLWDELITDDIESSREFYGELFGWKSSDIDMHEMGTYTVFKCADGTDVAGMVKGSSDAGKSAWITYLATKDIDAAQIRAKTLGASVRTETIEVPNVGRFAIFADSVGAVFGLLIPNEFRQR